MITKTIKYTDLNGVEQEKEFRFHLSKAELLLLNLSEKGGMDARLQEIIDTEDLGAIAGIYKDIIELAYGEKTEDGQRFTKSKEKTTEFMESEAFSELFVECMSAGEAATTFINGCCGLPNGVVVPPHLQTLPNPAKQ